MEKLNLSNHSSPEIFLAAGETKRFVLHIVSEGIEILLSLAGKKS
jgi:hypothetical protein